MGFHRGAAGVTALTFLILLALWPAPAPAQDDPIGDLIRQVRNERGETPAPRTPETNPELSATYELMARNLTRAALSRRRSMLQQPLPQLANTLRGMLIQATYETGRFKSGLAIQACNYWGMKDRMDVSSSRIFYKGENYEKFPSMFEGCRGYIEALNRARYNQFESHTESPQEFLRYLTKAGWCPKETYVVEAMTIYDEDREEIENAVSVAVNELLAYAKK